MQEKQFDRAEERELEQAEGHLREAEADLQAAGIAEETAEHEIEKATREVEEALHRHREIHFTVDGEPEETEKRELTADQIISEYGEKDPTTNYLVEIEGGHRKDSFKGRGGELIRLHDGMQFQIIPLGPTPVSDGRARTGVEAFVDGLKDLGYAPTLPEKPDHVVIDYEVQSGRFTGKKVRHGFVVPKDFPEVPPSGPHVSPHIHPIHPSQDIGHPLGAVQESGSFEEGVGGQWQYWSRPFSGWALTKKTVAVYMSHIWRLWDSQ
jgi:hypothetical protein